MIQKTSSWQEERPQGQEQLLLSITVLRLSRVTLGMRRFDEKTAMKPRRERRVIIYFSHSWVMRCQLGPNTGSYFWSQFIKIQKQYVMERPSNANCVKQILKYFSKQLYSEKHKLWIVGSRRKCINYPLRTAPDPISWLIRLDMKVWAWDKVIWSDPCRLGSVSAQC